MHRAVYSVYKFLWGKKKQNLDKLVSKETINVPSYADSEDKIREEVTFYDLGKIEDGFPEQQDVATVFTMRFYLRDDYKDLDKFMDKQIKEKKHTILIGQPGIGLSPLVGS
jgi:hypothetical protein